MIWDEVLLSPLIVLYGGISKGMILPYILIYVCEKDSSKLKFRIIVITIKKGKNVIKYLYII
jgi:hypothetical protein